ncbi:MAG: glutathionylspermidine synthase family protein [Polyangiaceae bacterium]|nr:glutathionylspermidine synthase family protein [Polyangiaceae bacterium]
MTSHPGFDSYDAFARALIDDGVLTDPWLDGKPRFDLDVIRLSVHTAERLATAARDAAFLWNEAVRVVSDDAALLDDFYALTPVQKVMFSASQPLWHGIARADVFFTSDGGLAVAELNCDTPTGEAEAVTLSAFAQKNEPHLLNPNAELGDRFVEMLFVVRDAIVGPNAEKTVGIVYPTELTEDLSLVRLYKKWLEKAGLSVALGSPYNLRRADSDGALRVFDESVGLLVRHYKTDWWSERASAWDDEVVADAAPLAGPLHAALMAQADGKTAIVNPFGAVVAQNKRTMALMWEHIHRFSVRAQDLIREIIPVTFRLESAHPAMVRSRREDWVLKSDYGAEGDEVVIGRQCTQAQWEESLDHARRGKWIAQRFFEAKRDEADRATNYGVFVIAGEPCGVYARRDTAATHVGSLSVPVMIDPDA